MRHFQQVIAATHEIDEGPVEERFVQVVGTATAEAVIPVKLAVFAAIRVLEGMGRLLQGLQQEPLLRRPRWWGGYGYCGRDLFHVTLLDGAQLRKGIVSRDSNQLWNTGVKSLAR